MEPFVIVKEYMKGKLFDDGSHIIYVNGAYEGDDSVGRLMSDFHSPTSAGMYYPELAEGVMYYKETKGGKKLCQV